MKATSALVLFGMVSASTAACVTVNIYFPAPQVRAAAEEIVEETWGEGAPPPAESEPVPDAGSSAIDGVSDWIAWLGPRAEDAAARWLAPLGPSAAWAADEPDINVSTAAIRTLKDAMKARAPQLKPFLAAGSVGLANNGMLVMRDLTNVPLPDQAKIRRLVEAENRDRQALYAEIAKANDIGPERVADIQKIFAETWIEKAEPGWPIQTPSGEWTKK